MMQWSAIKAHNLEVVGSNPTSARSIWLRTSTWYALGNAKLQPKLCIPATKMLLNNRSDRIIKAGGKT